MLWVQVFCFQIISAFVAHQNGQQCFCKKQQNTTVECVLGWYNLRCYFYAVCLLKAILHLLTSVSWSFCSPLFPSFYCGSECTDFNYSKKKAIYCIVSNYVEVVASASSDEITKDVSPCPTHTAQCAFDCSSQYFMHHWFTKIKPQIFAVVLAFMELLIAKGS